MLSEDAISKFIVVWWTHKCAEDLENAYCAQTCSFTSIWQDDFKHCINWSCYRE